MSQLLRTYIKNILVEAKKKDADSALLSNQVMGYAAEHAVYAALRGPASTEEMSIEEMLQDSRIKKVYPMASVAAQRVFIDVYKKMMSKALPAANIKKGLGSTAANIKAHPDFNPVPPGGGNRPVDVETSTADVHVKYNDFKRLVGFQQEKDEDVVKDSDEVPEILEPGAETIIDKKEFGGASTAYDNSLNEFFQLLQKKSSDLYKKLKTEDPESLYQLTSPKTAPQRATHMHGRLGGRKKAKSFGEESQEYKEFLDLRDAYQQALKIVGRDIFYMILDKNKFKEAVLEDIERLIFNSQNKFRRRGSKTAERKKIYFAKFSGPEGMEDIRKPVTCVYYDYSELLGIGSGKGMASRIADRMIVKEMGGNYDTNAAVDAAMKDAAKKSKRSIEAVGEESGDLDTKALTTIFYQVVDINDESKVYFQIEFRLDGDSHPPQLKTGRAIMSLGKKP